ncbi:hypothetical protein [Wolbachia endosymbiont of Tettigetta isshikii]
MSFVAQQPKNLAHKLLCNKVIPARNAGMTRRGHLQERCVE